jgi:hypothetical protein
MLGAVMFGWKQIQPVINMHYRYGRNLRQRPVGFPKTPDHSEVESD